jgi:isoquinoline 1-oxidoreductase alpha subunit
LWVLRDVLGLTGTKFGCGSGLCGACTVHIDGKPMRSCQIAVSKVAGKKITTIEGLAAKGQHPLQKAWIAEQVPQCGYCQSGQIMQAAALLATNKKPTREQIIEHMSTNICRCGTYQRIVRAVERARGRRNMNKLPKHSVTLSRRQVMIGAAGFRLLSPLGAAPAAVLAIRTDGPGDQPMVSIAPDGSITIMSAATEMGQGSMTRFR